MSKGLRFRGSSLLLAGVLSLCCTSADRPAARGDEIAERAAALERTASEDERIRLLRLPFVTIPAGKFKMGCSPGDNKCDEDEKPSHLVTLTKSFDLMATDVTAGQFRMWEKANHHQPPQQPGWSGDDVPVVNVTWDEARAFCSFVGGRLPTEAEWEYAARAGSSGARYGALDDVAWYGDNSGNSRIDAEVLWNQNSNGYDDALKANGNRAHPVGRKAPNALGLYDMLGNVWQWTADWYGERYYRTKANHVDPRGPVSGDNRVLRGGSWDVVAGAVRASFRLRNDPAHREGDGGFRCARDAHSPVTVPFFPGRSG